MFCELCCRRGVKMNVMDIQHKEMLQKLGTNLRGKNNSSQMELALWICNHCEKNVIWRYESKLKSEAAKESHQTETELKENAMNQLPPKTITKCVDSQDHQYSHSDENNNNNSINAVNNYQDVVLSKNIESIKEDRLEQEDTLQILQQQEIQCDSFEIFDLIVKEEPNLNEYHHINSEISEDFHHSTIPENITCQTERLPGNQNPTKSAGNIAQQTSSKIPKFDLNNFYKKMDNNYFCSLCSAKYSSLKSVKQHLKSIHFEYRYLCTECGIKLKSMQILKNHFKNMHKNHKVPDTIPMTMNKNPKAIGGSQNDGKILTDQIRSNLKMYYKKEANYNVCLLCQDANIIMKFKNLTSVRKHLKYKHFELRFVCAEESCDYRCIERISLKKHYKNKHPNLTAPHRPNTVFSLSPKSITPLSSYKEFYKKENNSTYVCKKCEKKFKSCVNIVEHITSVHLGTTYDCEKCDKKIKNRHSINSHNWKVNNSKENANKIYDTPIKDEPIDEPQEEFIEEPIDCSLTEKKPAMEKKRNLPIKTRAKRNLPIKTSAKKSLAKFDYENTYTKEENNYKCMLCAPGNTNSRKFPTCDAIINHIKYQHFKFKYICTECGWKCCRGSLLRAHYEQKHEAKAPTILATTSSLKPSIHEQKYKNRQLLPSAGNFNIIKDKHFKKEGQEYICLMCLENGTATAKYKHWNTLSSHIRFRHFKIKFKCSECECRYVNRRRLVDHQREKHINTEPTAAKTKTTINWKRVPSVYYEIKDSKFVCTICRLEFAKKDGVGYHINTVHFGIKYKCSKCHLLYKGITAVKEHMKRVHNISNENSFITVRNMEAINKPIIKDEKQKNASSEDDDGLS